jgi:hypothetical protein
VVHGMQLEIFNALTANAGVTVVTECDTL